jgi:ACR3 family arsenite efflux pump ArsB
MVLNKIDVTPILRAHFATLRDNRFGQAKSFGDVLVFLGVPLIVAILVQLIGFHFRIDAVNGFLNVFAILTGLLLNLLVLVITLASNKAAQQVNPQKRALLIKEIFANLCFSVLVAIVVVCTALVALSYMRSDPGATTGPGATWLLAALTTNFVLNLLMILKRMYILLNKELNGDSSSHSNAA